MTEMVLDTRTLPESLFELIRTSTVKVRAADGIINLIPITENATDDVLPKSTSASSINKKEAARNFLIAMKELRKNGFTPEDDESINEFQSGAYKMQFEERL